MNKQSGSKFPIRVLYASAVYGKEEIQAVGEVLQNPLELGAGQRVKEFEKRVAALFGKKFGVMLNSGSSANLLAFDILALPRGSEVITPVLTFSTTVAPILQQGLVPVFIDVEEGNYVIDVKKIEAAITPKTKALMIPLLLGNVPNMQELKKIAKKHRLILIEDSCDTLGATFGGKPTGAYSHLSTASFYASHIITTAGIGGMLCLTDPRLARKALIKSNWGRNSTLFGPGNKSEDIKKRFAGRIDGMEYDAKFIFSEVGYNLQSGELNAAFGLKQLQRLKKFGDIRKKNFKRLNTFFKKHEKYFILPAQDSRVSTNWLAFPLTIKPGAPFSRSDLVRYFEENGIQTRPIFTGNILRQPAFKKLHKQKNFEAFPNAELVMKNGFLVGCHQGLSAKHILHIEKTFSKFAALL